MNLTALLACGAGAAGGGVGITGVPITQGPLGTALLGITAAALIVAAVWLMRRWSGPATGRASAAATHADGAPATAQLDPELASELDRIESRVVEEQPAAVR